MKITFKKLTYYFCIGFSLSLFLSTLISLIQPGRGEDSLLFRLFGIGHGTTIMLAIFFLCVPIFSEVYLFTKKSENLQDSPDFFPDTSRLPIFLTINFLVFTAVSYYWFSKNHSSLFSGVDGDYTVSLFYSQRVWNNEPWYFTSNFLQGLGGNIIFPLNTIIDPAYFLTDLLGKLDFTFVHVIWSLLLFLSTFIFSSIAQLPLSVSILAAWIVPVQILYSQRLGFYSVASLIPHISTTISLCLLVLALIWINKSKLYWLVIRSVIISLLVLCLFLLNPSSVLLVSPILVVFSLLRIYSCDSPQVKFSETIMFAITALVISLSGTLPFFVGLFANSAALFFRNDFNIDRGSLVFASTVFSGYGLITVPPAILGLLKLSLNKLNSQARWISIGGLLYASAILICGLLNWRYPNLWRLPSPIYFEFFLWPIYCVGLASFANDLIPIFYRFIQSKVPGNYERAFSNQLFKLLINSSPCLLLFLGLVLYSGLRNPGQRSWLFPPPDSAIMGQLAKDLSHKPGDQFKGRVATFTGMNIANSVNWSDLQGYDDSLLSEIDNDMRKAGFWINSIPTMTEYNSHITPRFYYLTTQFLARPGDRQIRSMMTLRSLNPKILQLLGITHVVIDTPNSLFSPLVSDSRVEPTIYLYKIQEANTSGFSPINVIYPKNIREAVNLMKSDEFDFKSTITVEKPLNIDSNLVPVNESRITVNDGSYRIIAKSNGESILVLPIEYSSCFDATNYGSPNSVLDVFPGNTLLMSILFNKNLDIELRYANGPFNNSSCRLNDYAEFKKRF